LVIQFPIAISQNLIWIHNWLIVQSWYNNTKSTKGVKTSFYLWGHKENPRIYQKERIKNKEILNNTCKDTIRNEP